MKFNFLGIDFGINLDKILHFLYSFAIVYVLKLIIGLPYAITVGVLVGVLKEMYDWKIKETYFDLEDLAFDILGIICAAKIF